MISAMMGATACPYFVGMGFYTRDTAFDPATVWPGTKWQKLEGVFILAAGSGHAVGETGGEETHTLAEAEMPAHNHLTAKGPITTNDSAPNFGEYTTYQSEAIIDAGKRWTASTCNTGGSKPHNNMPPYAVRVYWERTK